ncbi:hypothetical protein BD626DRAFT_184457 [Schizophyllum amplum]|uniref:Uncharacterized protein n=1 Tax=Schizophyllum amplum TaxID=97359 RepID=A0A550C194_9AGAR|nr:hypothetical protein BD626DRAFT_184457 [Auriculariopsis ampla]
MTLCVSYTEGNRNSGECRRPARGAYTQNKRTAYRALHGAFDMQSILCHDSLLGATKTRRRYPQTLVCGECTLQDHRLPCSPRLSCRGLRRRRLLSCLQLSSSAVMARTSSHQPYRSSSATSPRGSRMLLFRTKPQPRRRRAPETTHSVRTVVTDTLPVSTRRTRFLSPLSGRLPSPCHRRRCPTAVAREYPICSRRRSPSAGLRSPAMLYPGANDLQRWMWSRVAGMSLLQPVLRRL